MKRIKLLDSHNCRILDRLLRPEIHQIVVYLARAQNDAFHSVRDRLLRGERFINHLAERAFGKLLQP